MNNNLYFLSFVVQFVKTEKKQLGHIIIFRYFCEEEFCQNGLFIPPQCEDRKCGTLLADFPGILHIINIQ